MISTPSAAVDTLREALAYVDSWLDYRLWKLRTPGTQVAVWFDGTVQFSKAYGLSNLDTGEALTTAHLFRKAREAGQKLQGTSQGRRRDIRGGAFGWFR